MATDTIENKIWQYWETSKVYKWDQSKERADNFVIDTPPPTVSGKLHIGHIFSYTHIDFIARFQRMIGKNVFYPVGFDDNGLPTERLVEKQRCVKASQMPREEFVKICQEVVKEEEEKFKVLFKKMAYSFDWSLEYQTISRQTTALSQLSFLDLIKKGQIYRKDQPVLWDPVDQTALAQAEIEDKEKISFMNDINFDLEGGGNITIATTRPELLAACVAVLVNPEDDRYKHLIGSYVITPLFGSKVKIIADESVLIDKGTGAVMCCTFGDVSDIMWWKKHQLQTKMILNKLGRIAHFEFNDENSCQPELARENYANIVGLKVVAAREKVMQMLQSSGAFVKRAEKTQMVKCAERSGAPLEILITSQWFIKTIEHKEKLLELSAQLNWCPPFMQNRLDSWINGVSWDWCISRQRFFGVPFPVWYSKRKGQEGKILLASQKQLPVDPACDLPEGYLRDEVEAEVDVMDTWATSCISPQINSHAITDEFAIDIERHKKIFPADLRPQAHEIIRIWAFGTILKSYLHEGVLPWKNIMVSGWCLAEDRSKMSKSKGNIIEPMGLLEEFGVDAIRYWASTSKSGSDTSYSHSVVLNGKKLVSKIKNAAKFCELHFQNLQKQEISQAIVDKKIYCASDLWLIDKLNQVIRESTSSFEKFEYCAAREVIEEFFWKDFCDTYLELVKGRIYNDNGQDSKGQQSAAMTLHHALDTLLRLFAPFLPYTSEEVWLDVLKKDSSVHIKGSWPKQINFSFAMAQDCQEIIFEVLEEVRKAKTQRQLSMKAPIKSVKVSGAKSSAPEDLIKDLANVTCASSLEVLEQSTQSLKVEIMF